VAVRIARNVVIDAARRGRVADAARRRLGMSAVTLDDDQLARIEERGRIDLAQALSALSHEQREAVIQRVLAEEPYAAIAERVERPRARSRAAGPEHPPLTRTSVTWQ
jgi:DNA-directed RNA polymerase specialized sigma24 family protein